MAEWKIKKEKTEKTEDESMELEGEEKIKDEDEESEEKEDIEDDEELKEESEESAEEEPEKTDEEFEGEDEKEDFKISRVDFSGIRAESLESEVEETREGGGESEGRESFEDFASPMNVREIAAPVLASAPMSSATGGIEEEVGGITEAQNSRERREQAARTPIADYTAGAYERNYWVGGEERRREPKDIEMGITRAMPRRDAIEIVDTDTARRIDFSAWQRSMEAQDVRGVGRRDRTNPEEYLVDVKRESEERRLPFERREEKRKYKP